MASGVIVSAPVPVRVVVCTSVVINMMTAIGTTKASTTTTIS